MRKTIVQGGCRLFISHPSSTASLRLFFHNIVLAVAIFIIPNVVAATDQAQGFYYPCSLPMSSDLPDSTKASFATPFSITPPNTQSPFIPLTYMLPINRKWKCPGIQVNCKISKQHTGFSKSRHDILPKT
jgi:hypothetical protein